VGPQKKTSIKSKKYDIEAPHPRHSKFSGLGNDFHWGVFDDELHSGKRRKTLKLSKISSKKRIRRRTKKFIRILK
jgi:hypothetical protein